MNSLLITVPAALIPSAFLLIYIYRKDLNREPINEVIRTFILGILLVIPVVIFAYPLRPLATSTGLPYADGFLNAFILAALPEEFFKFLLLYFVCMRRLAFDEEMDGLVYGAVASLGFATFENVLYVLGSGFGTAVARAITAVPAHASLGIIMGYYLVKWKRTQKLDFFLMALLLPIALHTAYDFPLMVIKNFKKIPSDHHLASFLLLMMFLACITIEFRYAKKALNLVSERQKKAAVVANTLSESSSGFGQTGT